MGEKPTGQPVGCAKTTPQGGGTESSRGGHKEFFAGQPRKGRGEDPLFPLNLVSPEVNGFFSKHNVIKFRKGLPPASPVIGLTKGPKRSKFLWQYPAVSYPFNVWAPKKHLKPFTKNKRSIMVRAFCIRPSTILISVA